MNNFFQKWKLLIFIIAFAVPSTLFLSSCSKKLGYGVVNWSIPEYNLTAGDIIPVYVKSNIEKVYIVGLNEKTAVRIEIPLWQLTFFESKKMQLNFKQDWVSINTLMQGLSWTVFRCAQTPTIPQIRFTD